MTNWGRIGSIGAAVALLLVADITTGAQAQVAGGNSFGSLVLGTGEAGMQIKGKVVCAGCSLAEVRKVQADKWGNHLYRLTHRQKQLVMEVTWISNPRRWNHMITTPYLRLRGAASFFEKLTAEENLFKEVKVVGVLSPSQTFDMNEVTILE